MSEETKTSVKDAISIYITPFLLTIISFFLVSLYTDFREVKIDIEIIKREQATIKTQMQNDRENIQNDKEAINKFHEKMSENIDYLKLKTQQIELDIAKKSQ